jgi:hypothetical protein
MATNNIDVHKTYAMFYVTDFMVLNIGTSDVAELSKPFCHIPTSNQTV